jgi:predicted glycosyltransferase
MMDYEFQPANHISFRLASRVVVPAAFPQERLRHYGVRSDARVRRFDGYKEELYLDRDAGSGDDGWGTPAGSGDAVRCLFRPPPHGAMYHRDGNSQFDELVIRASGRSDTSVLVLPRFPEQRDQYGSLPRVRVADRTVDGLRTLRGADVFIGAGGTMCREAALLGVPAYTVFAGQIAAVDERLIAAGGLRDLRAAELDVERWAKRDAGESRRDVEQLHARADTLRRWLVSVIEDAAGDPGRRR